MNWSCTGSTLLTHYGPFDQTLSYNRTQVLSSSRYGVSTSRYLGSSPCQARAHNYPREMERGRVDAQLDLRVRHGDTSGRAQVRGQGNRPNVVRGRSTSRPVHSPVSPLSLRRRSVSYSDLAQELVLLDINDPPSPPPRQHRVGRVGAMRNGILLRNSENSKSAQGLVGLRNLGNTCFMNSILQCLSNTHDLRDYCLRNCHLTDMNKSCRAKAALMEEFAKLTQTLWTSAGNEAISPSDFKTQIQKYAPRFVGYNQQDAQEFLRFLLDGLHNEVNRVVVRPRGPVEDFDHLSDNEKGELMWNKYLEKEDSKVVDLFVGQLKSSLTCNECGFCSTVFDPFWDLSLPIPKKSSGEVTLTDCIKLFTKEDVLDGDEKPICQRCKSRRKCTKKFTIQKFPKVLVLHLKRFSEPGRVKTSKLSTFVNFPLKELDLREFASENSATGIYNLYAVSNHTGTTLGGHYTAYCRNTVLGEWYSFNDSRVSPMSSSQVRSSDAYVLFYELATSSRL